MRLKLNKNTWMPAILVVGILFRLLLALVNIEPNDNYVEPVLLWIETGAYPNPLDCWECFQPPMFISLIRGISWMFNLTTLDEVYWTIQVVNLILSIGILISITRIIFATQLSLKLKIPLSLFWGLNPEIISMGALGSNDTLLVFLGILLTPHFDSSVVKKRSKGLVQIIFLITLAASTKGNGLIFLLVYPAIFLVVMLVSKKDAQTSLKSVWGLILIPVVFTFILGGYANKLRSTGQPFVTNQIKPPSPPLVGSDSSFNGRAGVQSITRAYFTFRYRDLLYNPFNSNLSENYPIHRTSMWSQLFGQFCSYFFESHPPSWTSNNVSRWNVARVTYFALLPLFVGFAFWFFRSRIELFEHKIVFLLFLMFVIAYSYTYRDFSTMKLMFVLPALGSIIFLFARFTKWFPYKNILAGLLWVSSVLFATSYFQLLEQLIVNESSYIGVLPLIGM